MKIHGLCLLIFLSITTAAIAEDAASLASHRSKTSYAVGVNLIGNLKQQGVDLDMDLVIKGMRDAFSGSKHLMSDEDIKIYVTRYQNEVRVKQAKTRTQAAETNKKAEAAFLAENGQKEGVITLPSGLQYKVLKKGQGKSPGDGDTVEINYRGATIQGVEIDRSARMGKPTVSKVKGAMPGLSEALKLMQVGAKWQIFIPSKLAYGERGNGNAVGPHEAIVFEVELAGIK